MDHRLSLVVGDLQGVGREASAALSELDGDADRPTLATADQLAEATAPGDGLGDVLGERLLQEAEHVEEGGLARAVRADHHGQARQVVELRVAKEPVVLDLQGFDLHGSALFFERRGPLVP